MTSCRPIGSRTEYRESPNSTGYCRSRMRWPAPRPSRHSSSTTPRSRSTSSGSRVIAYAHSLKMSKAVATTSGSVGTSSRYTVSSKLV